MDRTLVEDAEDEVDRDQRGENQDRCAAQRILKCLCAALEARRNRSRQVQVFRGLLDCRHRRADGDIRGKVEARGQAVALRALL